MKKKNVESQQTQSQEPSTLGARIKQLRKTYRKSQLDFAEEMEISQGHVSQLENDTVSPSIDVLRKISQHYPDVNFNWIISNTGPITKQDAQGPNTDLEQKLAAQNKRNEELEEEVKRLRRHEDALIQLLSNQKG